MDHETMLRAGVTLVRAMMRSASSDKIRPLEWWPRAQTALETAARCSSTFSALVSTMGRKLQIDTLRAESAADVAFLAEEVAASFDAWTRFLAEESLYVVALAQVERRAERDQRPTPTEVGRAVAAAKRAAADPNPHNVPADVLADLAKD